MGSDCFIDKEVETHGRIKPDPFRIQERSCRNSQEAVCLNPEKGDWRTFRDG
jgi:hypothetical protein